jgi:hypothetical protein
MKPLKGRLKDILTTEIIEKRPGGLDFPVEITEESIEIGYGEESYLYRFKCEFHVGITCKPKDLERVRPKAVSYFLRSIYSDILDDLYQLELLSYDNNRVEMFNKIKEMREKMV